MGYDYWRTVDWDFHYHLDLVVIVPLSVSGDSQDVTETGITTKRPQPKRKQRWIEIDKILQGNSKMPRMGDSTASSNITWNQ